MKKLSRNQKGKKIKIRLLMTKACVEYWFLFHFYSFYKEYPEIFHSPSGKSVGVLSWSYHLALLQVNDKIARNWHEEETPKKPSYLVAFFYLTNTQH